ncbi:MAG: hypothetical protein QG635_1808, partial [Bacteroidota bacterium]|nr:hypothetical protein [Bacteroidota bacterium]
PFLLLIFFVFIMQASQIYSQDCGYDQSCSETSWINDTTPIVRSYLGCDIYVHYRFRQCPGGTREMEITSIINKADCSGLTDEFIFGQALRALLAYSRVIFWGQLDSFNIKYYNPVCYQRTGPNLDTLMPCEASGCCATEYALVLGGGGMMQVDTKTSMTFSELECSGLVGGPCGDNYCAVQSAIPEDQQLITNPEDCPDDCYWTLKGNLITGANNKFLGTISDHPLSIRTCSKDAMYIDDHQQVGILNLNPQEAFHIGEGMTFHIG